MAPCVLRAGGGARLWLRCQTLLRSSAGAPAQAGQAHHRWVGLRANLENFSDVETNWRRDRLGPRGPACPVADGRQAGLGADRVRRACCPSIQHRPAATGCRAACSRDDGRHSSASRAAGDGCRATSGGDTLRGTRSTSRAAGSHLLATVCTIRAGDGPTTGNCSPAAARTTSAGSNNRTARGRSTNSASHAGRRRAAAAAPGRSGACRGAPATGRAGQGQCRTR